MNLRRITLKYMGWCPGVDRAARFIPDNEIPFKPWILRARASPRTSQM